MILRRTLFLLAFFSFLSFTQFAHAQTEYVLHSFCSQGAGGSCTDGELPAGGVVMGTDGNFYGTTNSGGPSDGSGTVYKITPAGVLTTLYTFCTSADSGCLNGQGPAASMVLGTDGNFYGTTIGGGVGTVFKITPAGVLTNLYTFCQLGGDNCTDGYNPQGGLALGSDGNFYGTTASGGNSNQGGTVYKVTPSGTLTTLHSFCESGTNVCADGSQPVAGLVQGKNGEFYGTTTTGGADTYGTAFEVPSTGGLTTIYTFCSAGGDFCNDGANPYATLLLASDGNFYGTTTDGGMYSLSGGTIFRMTPSGALTTLYSFCSDGGDTCTDGQQPTAPLVQGIDDYLYGTTTAGGADSLGTVFKTIGPALAKSTSVTKLTVNPNPVTVGQTVTFAATVDGNGATPTGTVNFTLGANSLLMATLSSGTYSFGVSTNGVPPGTYPIVATYSGNSTYNSSTSVTVNAVVDAAPTSTVLTPSPNPVTPPEEISLTVTVKRSASKTSGTPTGSVSLYLGATEITTATLNSSGTATITIPTSDIPAGTYPLTAKYSGDSFDSTSTSPVVNVIVK